VNERNGDFATLSVFDCPSPRRTAGGDVCQDGTFVRYVQYGTETRLFAKLLLKDSAGASSPREKAAMENSRVDELRAEVSRLLEKQSEVLESRTFGAATDTEILEYEIRREVIQEICDQLANSTSG